MVVSLQSFRSDGQPLPGILHGSQEPIFEVLPYNVLSNLRSANSENARLWNLIYPLAQPWLSFKKLMKVEPLWGTLNPVGRDDQLRPYFWGYACDGSSLPALREAVLEVDGSWPGTEIDLCLVGKHNLVVVEAKVSSRLGRCGRFAASACPEVHLSDGACQYWAEGWVQFSPQLEFGVRPKPAMAQVPACHRHYQLGRTLLIGRQLAAMLGLTLHLWLLTPERNWRSLKSDWSDFAGRVRDPHLWRRLRAVPWEALSNLPRR